MTVLSFLNFGTKISNDFQNEDMCVLAELNYEIGLKSLEPSPECLVKQNWGFFDRISHVWNLSKNISLTIESIRCKYRKVIRVDDFRVQLGHFRDLLEGDTILDDVLEVECNGFRKIDNSSVKFENLYVQVVDTEIGKKSEAENMVNEHGCTPYDVMLISYDSVSRVSFVNRLKKTFDFINKSQNFFVLNGYNIVGDGTPAGFLPINKKIIKILINFFKR